MLKRFSNAIKRMGKKNSYLIPVCVFLIVFLFSANGSIAADCGGAIPCNCGDTITTDYTMAANIGPCADTGLIISADDISLDCNNFVISGPGQFAGNAGIELTGRTGVNVKHCRINRYRNCIKLTSTNRSIIDNNFIADCFEVIHVEDSNENNITNNIVLLRYRFV